MNILFHAHSGLRYLVLLVAVVALAVFLYGLATRRDVGAARGLMAAFVGVLDLQALLGIILLLLWPFYGALIGHIVMMILAVAAAHVASVMARKSTDARRAMIIRTAGVAASLVLVIGGIMAIGRDIL